MKALFRLGILMVLLNAPFLLHAQWDYPQYNMSQTSINACFGRLYDSGGPTAPYGINENITTVIEADGIVTLTFYGAFSLQEDVDFLIRAVHQFLKPNLLEVQDDFGNILYYAFNC